MTDLDKSAGGHKWVPSTLGHGNQMCANCGATEQELAALGELDRCDKAPTPTLTGDVELARELLAAAAIFQVIASGEKTMNPQIAGDMAEHFGQAATALTAAHQRIEALEGERNEWRWKANDIQQDGSEILWAERYSELLSEYTSELAERKTAEAEARALREALDEWIAARAARLPSNPSSADILRLSKAEEVLIALRALAKEG